MSAAIDEDAAAVQAIVAVGPAVLQGLGILPAGSGQADPTFRIADPLRGLQKTSLATSRATDPCTAVPIRVGSRFGVLVRVGKAGAALAWETIFRPKRPRGQCCAVNLVMVWPLFEAVAFM